jgi:hypothetical protein
MDNRIVEFIAALRGAGVRVSVAESADAMRAIEATGIADKDFFRMAMRATLVKEPQDIPRFEELFPQYFGGGPPPMQQPGGGMSDEEREQMMQALEEMLRNMTPEQLRQLFESMMTGQPMDSRQMRMMAQQSLGMTPMMRQGMQPWMSRRAMRNMEFDRLDELLQELLEKLREAGVSEQALQELAREARENQGALAEQMSQEIGRAMAQQAAEEQQRQPQRIDELLDRSMENLSREDVDDLRQIVTRLAAQLRTRAALRQKRASRGTLDAKSTIRANQKFGGVPLDVRHKRKHLKPKLVVICDRSRSTESVVRFLLTLIYTLQDQISRTRSFAFIETIYDVSNYFDELRPDEAIDQVMQNVYPKRSYSTDLGASLEAFLNDYGGCVDHRTTVIILGDGRNNENDPNLAALTAIKQRARRIVWFNPEQRYMWGKYDPGSLSSDMLKYMPLCDAAHQVSSLRELVNAVDSLFVYR